MKKHLFALCLLTTVMGCSKPENANVDESEVAVSAHTYPSDPKAAGWDKPADVFKQPVEKLIPEVNRLQEAQFSRANELEAVPLERLQSSESLAPDIMSPDRTALDRAQDRDENDVLNIADSIEGATTADELASGKKKTPPKKTQPRKTPPKPAPKPAAPSKSKPSAAAGGWDSVLPPAMTRGIDYGTSIGGPQPYSKKDASVFIPASIAKAVSVARGLEILGADYRFETKFTWRVPEAGVASQFTVTANGDPTIGSSDFGDGDLRRLKALIEEIKNQGVSEVRGAIKLESDDPRWDKTVHAPGVESKDYLACYGSLSQSFNVAGNCAVLAIRSQTSADWQMPEITVPISMNLASGKNTAISVKPVLDNAGHVTGYSVHGTWGRGRKDPALVRLPVPDSKTRMKNIIIRELKAAGIAYKPSEVAQNAGAYKNLSLYSPKLSEIIIPLLKESDNFLADAVFKRAGSEWANKTISLREAAQLQLAKGVEAWTKAQGFAHMKDELLLLDGAGLSRSNRATPRVYLTLMRAFSKETYFSALWKGLPIAGIDGTLISRLKNAKTRGLLRAKTGTVRGAYQLTGYMPDYNADSSLKEYVPFVILTSTAPGNGRRVYTIQERLLVRLAEVVNPSYTPPRIPMP